MLIEVSHLLVVVVLVLPVVSTQCAPLRHVRITELGQNVRPTRVLDLMRNSRSTREIRRGSCFISFRETISVQLLRS